MIKVALFCFGALISSRRIWGFTTSSSCCNLIPSTTLSSESREIACKKAGINKSGFGRSVGTQLSLSATFTSTVEEIQILKSRIEDEIRFTKRGLSATSEQKENIDSLVRSLEALCPYKEPARMPDMEGKWIVEYTTAPPPSNGKLGPFEGVARQIIDLEKGTYVNYLSVPGDIEMEFLSARLEATFEEWDGTLLKAENSKKDDVNGSDSELAKIETEIQASRGWFQTSIMDSIFQRRKQNNVLSDYGADSWKVDFKTLRIELFGFPLIQKSFDEGTSRVWKMSYLDPDGTRVVRAGRTGKEEDAVLFYMRKE